MLKKVFSAINAKKMLLCAKKSFSGLKMKKK